MRFPGDLPFVGNVVWLRPEEGGRSSGPPPTPPEHDYAATAFVPPHTADTGLASFILRVEDRAAWTSPATGGWLVVSNEDDQMVTPDTVVIVTEGHRPVAVFTVASVRTTGPAQ